MQKKKKRIRPGTIKATLPKVQNQNNVTIEENIRDDEDFEQPSSCVASMSDMKNPSLAQKELNIEDVKNSKMVNTILNLFQSPNPPKINSKL